MAKGKKSSVWFEEGKNDKAKKLEKNIAILRDRLAQPVPPKHAHRPEIFKDMIRRDIRRTEIKIENLK